MQKNTTIRPAVSSIIAGTLVASTLLASVLSAQARPPRPGPDQARAMMGDSQPPRRGPMRPGVRGQQPDARTGMRPGAPGNPSGRGMQGAPGMPGMGRQGMGPGRGGSSPATALLRMREGLDLTDEQVRRLQGIESSANRTPNSADRLRARADLMEAMRGDGNIDAARTAMERMNRLRTEEALAGLKARQDARNVLTPEQRSRAEGMLGGARRMELGNRDMRQGRAMLRQAPGARMRPRSPDVRPNMMQPLPPAVRRERMQRLQDRVQDRLQDRRMQRVPMRDRDVRVEPRIRRD